MALPAGVAADPIQVLAALGDPFQAFGLGLLQGLLHRGGPQVVLAGGSQMLALQALLLACLDPPQRTLACRQLVVATTSWVMGEQGSNLPELARRLAMTWGVKPQLVHAQLRFDQVSQQPLRDYERGYVKEGVGAGALAWLWELSGRSPQDLAAACDQACARLLAA